MLIAIVGSKGGQGKSTLSMALAYGCGAGIITNDVDGSVDEFLPEDRTIKLSNDDAIPDIPAELLAVFDGKAGIDEPCVLDAVSKADWVITPTVYGVEEVKRARRAIQQLHAINSNIIIVANRMKRAEFEELEAAIGTRWTFPLFWIRESRHVQELLFLPQSIHDKAAKGGLAAYTVKDICEQFDQLFAYLGLTRIS